jgi:hypothetical protein
MKTIVTIAVIFTITFILLNVIAASAAVIAVALLMLIPSKAWKAIVEMASYALFWAMIEG